jgi:hypothetical protein
MLNTHTIWDKRRNLIRKNPRWFLSIFLGVCLILGPLGQANGSLLENPASPQNGGIVVPPGNPIEIAVAMYNAWPNSMDINLAVQMAMDDYGSIKGFALQRNDYDAGCDQSSGSNAATSIVANAQNVGVVGPFCSSSTSGAAPVLETAGVVMISPSNTAVDLHTYGPNIFNRMVVADPAFDAWNVLVGALPSVQSWEANFTTVNGHPPDSFAKYAYDAAILLLTRIDQVSTVGIGGNLLIDRAALATAVRATSDVNGVTGQITLDIFGTRVSTRSSSVWTDHFTDPTLDARWAWIDEAPAYWSLTINPGFLRIITQSPTKNRLIQIAPDGDFKIRTRVLFTPAENFQFAGLSIYTDENNFMNFGRAYCNAAPPECAENAIYFDLVENGAFVPPNHVKTTTVQNEAYLLLERNGDEYTAYVSTNNTTWEEVGSHTTSITPAYVGLYASGQSSLTEIPADFDSFILESDKHFVYLPLTTK